MKIILLVGILFLTSANISAEKVITCKLEISEHDEPIGKACVFSDVTIGENEAFSIRTDPVDLDVNEIDSVEFSDSSIYSVPREVFTKFPSLETFRAGHQNIQELKPGTFVNGEKLKLVNLDGNALSYLHIDTFKGMHFWFHRCKLNNLLIYSSAFYSSKQKY
jgi:hypothetical protein